LNIWQHRYELRPGADPLRAAAAPRRGTLVKIEFENSGCGYTDLHPWEEFGHAPLEEHISTLPTDRPTSLAALALRHARTDAAARRAGVSLFEGLPTIGSHALFTDWAGATREAFEQCLRDGYSTMKLKVGRDPDREAATLNKLADLPFRWRLDANALFTRESLGAWLAQLDPRLRARIEFLEDPCPYDQSDWMVILTHEKIPLALDWQLPATPPPWPGAHIVVIKPAVQDAFSLALAAAQTGLDVVVTHSMDHPIGRAVALWTAMRLRQRHGQLVRDGGLHGGGLYTPDSFTEARGPDLQIPRGTGFGFNDLLDRLTWEKVVP